MITYFWSNSKGWAPRPSAELMSKSRLVSASPKSVVVKCLKEIKKGNYSDSYTFFSSSLKGNVNLEGHVSNLKSIENEYGHLVSFSDRHPLFKNYFLDEDMFKGMFSRKKQTVFRYLLTYEKLLNNMQINIMP